MLDNFPRDDEVTRKNIFLHMNVENIMDRKNKPSYVK